MRIVILGAGMTGTSVVQALAEKGNEISIVDPKPHALSILKERFKVHTVLGNAAFPKTLEQAGVREADIVVAVTDRDETNMLACTIINTLYKRPKTIARIRAIDFLTHPRLFGPHGIPADVVISPEQIIIEAIRHLIELPGVTHTSEFADGHLKIVSVKAAADSFVTGKRVDDLRSYFPCDKTRVLSVFRDGKALAAAPSMPIRIEDEIFLATPGEDTESVLKALKATEPPIKRIMIAGGGHIGKRLAQALEKKYYVKLIEKDLIRAQEIAEDLNHTVVLNASCADEALLIDESIDRTDLFCALTNFDGENILAASLAKRLGARKTICLLNNLSYGTLLPSKDLGVTLSPNIETLGSILTHVRHGDVVRVKSLCGGSAEAIEFIAHSGDSEQVVGLPVLQVQWPEGMLLTAIVRHNRVVSIRPNTTFQEGDRVIMFIYNKRLLHAIERKFQLPIVASGSLLLTTPHS